MAIRIVTRPKVRNEDTLSRLREMASDRPVEPVIAIERAAARIATEMARIHGGDWGVLIDHQSRLVLVRPY